MLTKQMLALFDLLDGPEASGESVAAYLRSCCPEAEIEVKTLRGPRGSTDMLRVLVPGRHGRTAGGSAPTLGILGRLGGVGARPERIGFVSDGDGALCALTVAAKLLDMARRGDRLEGDVVISTHICPNAPTAPHEPVPFMASPVDMPTVNREEVRGDLDAILCVDTTKGNRLLNHRGFAITPTVKEGWVLRVSESLLDVMQMTTGQLPRVFPITTQDITPYGNHLYHVNSILQPATATAAPVVGVAITAEAMVAGCATGASHPGDVEETARFMLEVCKAYTAGKCPFYDEAEFAGLVRRYGPLTRLQTVGRED